MIVHDLNIGSDRLKAASARPLKDLFSVLSSTPQVYPTHMCPASRPVPTKAVLGARHPYGVCTHPTHITIRVLEIYNSSPTSV
jgi:hypothetical protein